MRHFLSPSLTTGTGNGRADAAGDVTVGAEVVEVEGNPAMMLSIAVFTCSSAATGTCTVAIPDVLAVAEAGAGVGAGVVVEVAVVVVAGGGAGTPFSGLVMVEAVA